MQGSSKTTVFISRDLSKSSCLIELAARLKFNLIGRSLLTFEHVPFEKCPTSDWLFFYSQKGVSFFFDLLKTLPSTVNPNQKIGLIGPKALEQLQKTGLEAAFVGDGNPLLAGKQFLQQVKPSEEVTFIQAKNSRQSVQRFMANKRKTNALVVYDNIKKEKVDIPKADILVFMSPLNVEAYLDKKTITTEKVVSIGHTTADFLKNKGYDCFIPTKPSEAEIARTLEKMIQQ
jgi:Uroporphyrinogen-III synthase